MVRSQRRLEDEVASLRQERAKMLGQIAEPAAAQASARERADTMSIASIFFISWTDMTQLKRVYCVLVLVVRF